MFHAIMRHIIEQPVFMTDMLTNGHENMFASGGLL